MSNRIPFPFYFDDMPVDISSAFPGEIPAGRHGFVTVKGDELAFEDGHPARFWGVNFNGGACFPSFDYAEKVAARLRMTGVNVVRFHQLDAEWNTPNIFSFHKGQRIGSTLELHPESMKRLDYLVHCLKSEGIYCYLDMVTYRNFKSGDGVDNPFALGDAANPYNYYDEKLIELQKKFIYDIWNHVNPYTGLRYKDDPVFILSEIVNERDFFSRTGLLAEPYVGRFREKFAAWLREKGIEYDAMGCDVECKDKPLVTFKGELQSEYFRFMYAYMREVGVKIPITGTNWMTNGMVTKCVSETSDFMDSHIYFYDWRWGEKEQFCMQKALTQTPEIAIDQLTGVHRLDKPMFVSEWDMPWPNAYRAESSILYAAIGALQGYSGWAIHTYAYGTRLSDMKVLGKEVSSRSIGGVPYREGIFSVWNDPAKYGLFYHAALIARRQDVKKAEDSLAVKIPEDRLLDRGVPAIRGAVAEKLRVGVVFDGEDGANPDAPILENDAGEVLSSTGEMYRSWKKNYGWVDTQRTKCAYGFLNANGKIELAGMSVESKTDFAVIVLSSLTDAAIEKSDNLLLTAVGRAENTDMRLNGDKLEALGTAPVVVEVIEAEISVKTDNPTLKVWAVNAEGMFTGAVPSRYEDGCLRFTLGETMPSMYYLIQAE